MGIINNINLFFKKRSITKSPDRFVISDNTGVYGNQRYIRVVNNSLDKDIILNITCSKASFIDYCFTVLAKYVNIAENLDIQKTVLKENLYFPSIINVLKDFNVNEKIISDILSRKIKTDIDLYFVLHESLVLSESAAWNHIIDGNKHFVLTFKEYYDAYDPKIFADTHTIHSILESLTTDEYVHLALYEETDKQSPYMILLKTMEEIFINNVLCETQFRYSFYNSNVYSSNHNKFFSTIMIKPYRNIIRDYFLLECCSSLFELKYDWMGNHNMVNNPLYIAATNEYGASLNTTYVPIPILISRSKPARPRTNNKNLKERKERYSQPRRIINEENSSNDILNTVYSSSPIMGASAILYNVTDNNDSIRNTEPDTTSHYSSSMSDDSFSSCSSSSSSSDYTSSSSSSCD